MSLPVQMGRGASLMPGLDPIFPRVDAFLSLLPNLFSNTHCYTNARKHTHTHTTFYDAFVLKSSGISTHIR